MTVETSTVTLKYFYHLPAEIIYTCKIMEKRAKMIVQSVFLVPSMTLYGLRIITCHINLPTLYGGFDILASFISSRTCHPVVRSPQNEAR